jgi:uncharacterized protein
MVTNSCNTANCLLDHGADVVRESDQGSTALEQACAGGRRPVVKVFLKRGAARQILQASKSGHTPLSAAVFHGHEEITLLLLQQLVTQSSFDINHPRLALNQPLLCSAAVSGLCKVAEFALDHGADPNITGPDGPALILAVKHRHDSVVSLLCERSANVQTRFGPTNSLDQAVIIGDADMIKILLKHGADVNVSADSRQGTAVVKAAVLGKCEIVQLLFEAGAALDAALQHDTLTICCNTLEDSTAVKVVKVLLPHCSSLAENNFEFGHKILAHAVCKGKLQVAQLLHAAGADVYDTDRYHKGVLMHSAAASGNLAIVKWLQTLGLDARALCTEGQLLPLHYACEHQHLHIVKYLLAVPGAADDIHARSSEQETPLHGAAAHGVHSVVQLLLQRGADVNARDINECTPLMDADSLAVVKLLLAAGADATAVDGVGMTVLQWQARKGACAGTVCLLLKAGADPTFALQHNGISVTAATFAGINGHFALEALLSRAADDYRKKHPTTASSAISDSSSSSNDSSIGSSDTDSSSRGDNRCVIAAGVEYSDSLHDVVTDTPDSCAGVSISTTTAGHSGAADDSTGNRYSSSSNAVAVQADTASDTSLTQQQQQQQQCKQRKAKQPCANCSKPTTKLCRRCAAVYYCSVECQKVCFADAQHRAQCEAKAGV